MRFLVHTLLATSALAFLPVAAPAAIAEPAAQVATHDYDIGAGSLASALNHFSETSGVQLSYDASLTDRLTTRGVKGRRDTGSALSTLLEGTELGWRFVDARTITLQRRGRGAMQLDPVRVLASNDAEAKNAAEENEAGAGHDRERETIVVNGFRAVTTALSGTKMDTPLLETPQAISVISMDEMRARSILSVGDAVAYSAGVFANAKGVTYGGDAIALRGFGNDGTTGAAINTYIDGLRLSGTGYLSGGLDPWLYERIEVVKGPASVLFGQSVPGGLINMVSKRPQAEFGGEALLRFGSFGRTQVAFDVTGPATDTGDVLARFSGTYFNTHDIYSYSNRKRVMVAPAITWKPGDRTSITILGHYQSDDFAGSTLNWLPTVGTIISNPNGRISRRLFTGDPNYQRWDRKTAGVGYQFEHRFSDAVTLRQNLRFSNNRLDNQNTYISLLGPDLRTAERQAFGLLEHSNDLTIDTNVGFKFDTGPLSHKLLVGLDWQHLKSDTLREFAFAPTLDVFAPVYNQKIPARSPFRNQKYLSKQTGIYAQDQISFEGWRLLVGLRKDWASIYTYDIPSTLSGKQKSDKLTKRVALMHVFDNGLAPYASFSESFVPLEGTDAAGKGFVPETGRQFELGVKYQPTGTSSVITASLFDLRRRNVLTRDTSFDNDGDPSNDNFQRQTGEVRMRGFELEANVKLAQGFSMVGAYTFLDPRVTKSSDMVSGLNPVTLTEEERAQQGLRPLAVPRHNASLWLDYAGEAGVSAGAGVRYSSRTFADDANLSRVPSYALIDASLRFDLGHWLPSLEGLQLSAKVNNLFDKYYVASCSGVDRCYYGQARNVTVDLAWRW